MKSLKSALTIWFAFVVVASLQICAFGQTDGKNKIAVASASGLNVRWDVAGSHSGVTITIAAPDGRIFQKEFKAGALPEFTATDKNGERLPDGQYNVELRFTAAAGAAAKPVRPPDDEPEADRAARKRSATPDLVQSGSFSIVNGMIVVAGAVEGRGVSKATVRPKEPRLVSANTVTRLRHHRLSLLAMPDVVTADDEIIQGSLCVGLDCVSGENFGFDTIRLKENNTRIQFDDTSADAGFPTNNWQIRANSSANGGSSFLGFVDQGATGNSETGTIVFAVTAGAPANSMFVDSGGRLGLRTSTPVLDIHANTNNTPAMRLEQNNSGGFTAQTWDVAGNEANFFVRDVTGGSRLPFRIRPGAPTSSIDIAASGNVGVGTASPAQKLQVAGSGVQRFSILSMNTSGNVDMRMVANATNGFFGTASNHFLNIGTNNAANMTILTNGRVGVGTTAPDQVFSVNGDASKNGGGSWQVFSDERLKTIKGNFNRGLSDVMRLQPLRYEYKPDNALALKSEGEHIGFGAQALQKVIPEAVTKNAAGYLMVNNDPVIWTMLNAIKEQQQEIAELKAQVRKLRTASRKHRR
jgi:endosialidase-like protein